MAPKPDDAADTPRPRSSTPTGAEAATRMAATQRPVTQEALTEPSGEQPLWREVPSWFLVAEEDRNIPAALQRFMAERAAARNTIEIPGASRAVAVSRARCDGRADPRGRGAARCRLTPNHKTLLSKTKGKS